MGRGGRCRGGGVGRPRRDGGLGRGKACEGVVGVVWYGMEGLCLVEG